MFSISGLQTSGGTQTLPFQQDQKDHSFILAQDLFAVKMKNQNHYRAHNFETILKYISAKWDSLNQLPSTNYQPLPFAVVF